MTTALVWRFYRRHFWDPRLCLFACALAFSLASVLMVTLLADRLNQAVQYSGRGFLGADRILSDNRALDPSWQEQAEKIGLETQAVVSFITVLFAGETFELSSIRAVPPTYPFYGELVLEPQQSIQPDDIWLSEQLMRLLDVKIGDTLEMGEAQLQVAGIVRQAPEQRLTPSLFAPRAFVHADAVEKAKVIVPGSRVTYRLLLKGTKAKIDEFSAWIKPRLKSGQRFYGGDDGGTVIANSLIRTERFFRLSALIAVLLGCLGMSIALYQYTVYQNQQVALLKTLGASYRTISLLIGCLIFGTIFLGIMIGLGLGWAGHDLVVLFLGDALPRMLPEPSFKPVLLAGCMGLLMALLIAIIPFLRLLGVPVMRVLREDLDAHLSLKWMVVLVVLGNLGLVILFTGDAFMTLALCAGCFAVLVVLALFGSLFLALLRRFPQRGSIGFGLRALRRNWGASLSQSAIVAFALMLVASLWTLKEELLSDLKAQIPPDAPNRFIVNIPMDEKPAIADFLQENKMVVSDFYPVVRGRLVGINHTPVRQNTQEEGREGANRELNLTWKTNLPERNTITRGQWNPNHDSVSIEEGFAERLKINLGDVLTMRIGTEEFDVTVTSFREVNWQDFQPNFYLIFTPERMAHIAHSWLTGLRIEKQQRAQELTLMRQFPSAVVIDVETILDRVEHLATQLSRMLGLMMAMVMVLSLIVLAIQAQAAVLERYRELLLMRTFGASAVFLRLRLASEFSGLGLIAGLSAAAATQAMSACLYYFWLDKTAPFFMSVWVVLPLLGMSIVSVVTWPTLTHLVKATLSARLKQA